MLSPPEGAAAGGVHIRLVRGPPVPIDELCRQALASIEGPLATVGPRGFVSHEGEYGALVHIVAGGRQHSWAWILGEDRVGVLAAWCGSPEHFAAYAALIEELATQVTLGLGSDRWRPFFYTPPEGWHGSRRGWATRWVAPDHPHTPGILTVFDARPARLGATEDLHNALFERLDAGARALGPATVRSGPDGLTGQETRYRCGDDEATNVVLTDGRYLYPLRFERPLALDIHGVTPPGAAVLERVLASVQPLRLPRSPTVGTPGWAVD